MKKVLIAVLVLAAASGCKTKPTVLEGTITGYDGREVNSTLSGDLTRETVEVAEDGAFHIEKQLEEAIVGGLGIMKGGSYYCLILPGKHYHFDIDLTVAPASWKCESDCPAEQEFDRYMKDSLLRIDFSRYVFPDTFKEFDAMWSQKIADAEARLRTVKNRQALKYFRSTMNSAITRYKVNYATQLEKKGLSPAGDADYMAFFNSVDLSDEKMARALLSTMLQIKSDMYCDTIPASIRYIRAIGEMALTQQVKDSVACKYLESVIKDGRISSEDEGLFLMETAERLVGDEDVLADYRKRIDKALTLLPGNDAIDFEMTDTKGRTVLLSDFKGKVVYIDFWASWCIPCCLQIPYMKVLADKYSSDPDVACLSVSMDDNLENWRGMIENDKPKWPQYVTGDGGRTIMTEYGFRAIPRFMLFGKDGKIVNVYAPRPQDIEAVSEMIDSLK